MAARGRVESIVDRFWRKVERSDGCWIWSGQRDADGYGKLLVEGRRSSPLRGRKVSAHRFSAMLHFGMFDRRLMVCHTCDNPPCVNPAHLYLGDAFDNNRDRVARGRDFNARKTHCPKGHEYTPENTYRPRGVGTRFCRECSRRHCREYDAQRRLALAVTS